MRAQLVELDGRKVFVLNGLSAPESEEWSQAIKSLHEAVESEPDAVAFGCVYGKWVAAASRGKCARTDQMCHTSY